MFKLFLGVEHPHTVLIQRQVSGINLKLHILHVSFKRGSLSRIYGIWNGIGIGYDSYDNFTSEKQGLPNGKSFRTNIFLSTKPYLLKYNQCFIWNEYLFENWHLIDMNFEVWKINFTWLLCDWLLFEFSWFDSSVHLSAEGWVLTRVTPWSFKIIRYYFHN